MSSRNGENSLQIIEKIWRWCRGGVDVMKRWYRDGVDVIERWYRCNVEVIYRWCSGGQT